MWLKTSHDEIPYEEKWVTLRKFESPSEMTVAYKFELDQRVDVVENLFVDENFLIIHYNADDAFATPITPSYGCRNVQDISNIPYNRTKVLSQIPYLLNLWNLKYLILFLTVNT